MLTARVPDVFFPDRFRQAEAQFGQFSHQAQHAPIRPDDPEFRLECDFSTLIRMKKEGRFEEIVALFWKYPDAEDLMFWLMSRKKDMASGKNAFIYEDPEEVSQADGVIHTLLWETQLRIKSMREENLWPLKLTRMVWNWCDLEDFHSHQVEREFNNLEIRYLPLSAVRKYLSYGDPLQIVWYLARVMAWYPNWKEIYKTLRESIPKEDEMDKITRERLKLVRDLIPTIISTEGRAYMHREFLPWEFNGKIRSRCSGEYWVRE